MCRQPLPVSLGRSGVELARGRAPAVTWRLLWAAVPTALFSDVRKSLLVVEVPPRRPVSTASGIFLSVASAPSAPQMPFTLRFGVILPSSSPGGPFLSLTMASPDYLRLHALLRQCLLPSRPAFASRQPIEPHEQPQGPRRVMLMEVPEPFTRVQIFPFPSGTMRSSRSFLPFLRLGLRPPSFGDGCLAKTSPPKSRIYTALQNSTIMNWFVNMRVSRTQLYLQ